MPRNPGNDDAGARRTTVLLIGETGTGKEVVARGIHYNSPWADEPFIAVNCTAVPEALFESELFGHLRGSFTGATGDRKGRFELAGMGTIFLDEIGDVSLACQAKLLRVREDQTFRRLGVFFEGHLVSGIGAQTLGHGIDVVIDRLR